MPERHDRTSLGSCQARYASGEFTGAKCIENAKETRQGLRLCRRHAKVLDRWMGHGIDYAWSITRLEWWVDLTTGEPMPLGRGVMRSGN